VGAQNTTSVPSEERDRGADEPPQADEDRNKRNSGQAASVQVVPALAAVALRAAAQRLRDDAADPLLPDLVALILGARSANGSQRGVEQVLARQAPPQALAAIWSEAASHLEGLAERLATGQSGQQPFPTTSHNTDAEQRTSVGVEPNPAGKGGAP
jgi:hypothetical protein